MKRGRIMDIFNSNDYKRGYDDGYSAGSSGMDKDFSHSGISMKFAIHGGKAIDTYNQGYNDGYRKGIEDRHSKERPQKVEMVSDAIKERQISTSSYSNAKYNYSTTNINFGTMAQIQQYQVQLQKLEEMVSFLRAFEEQMEQNLNGYRARVQLMYETGMPEEVMRRFESDHIPATANLISQIRMLVDETIIPYTNNQIEIIRMAIDRS